MICTPDETGRCTTCGDMLSMPKKTADADRIARLTAELAEAKKQQRFGWERAAENDRAYGTALAERDAARAELAGELAISNRLLSIHNEAEARLTSERDAAHAEAAAMRAIHCHCGTGPDLHAVGQDETCEYYQHHCDSCHEKHLCTAKGCSGFVLWQAGRELAERVPLLERVSKAAHRYWHGLGGDVPSHSELESALSALAALEAKGGAI